MDAVAIVFGPTSIAALAPVRLIVKLAPAFRVVLGVLPVLIPVFILPLAVIEMLDVALCAFNELPLSISRAPDAPLVATSLRVIFPLLDVRFELVIVRAPDLAPLVLILIPETALTILD